MAIEPEDLPCPECGSATRLEAITRGGRPQVALCTNLECGWDDWIPEDSQPDEGGEDDEAS